MSLKGFGPMQRQAASLEFANLGSSSAKPTQATPHKGRRRWAKLFNRLPHKKKGVRPERSMKAPFLVLFPLVPVGEIET